MNYDPDNIVNIRFAATPEVALDVSKEKNIYSVKPLTPFAKGTEYALTILQTPVSINYKTNQTTEGTESEIEQINFKTIDAPGIKSSAPTGSNILTNQPISIEFLQDMDKASTEAAFSVLPGVTGDLSWESPRKIVFSATNLTKNTQYTVKLAKSALAGDGSPLQEDFVFHFTTIGYVSVIKFTPGNKASNITLDQRVIVTFNQAIDHTSAQNKFSITPNINGNFSWDGNSLSFSHDSFSYNQNYTIKIDAGIKSISGLDSKDAFSASFTTRQQNVALNVPAYHQAHMYSCEISALRSALAFWKINKTESEIINVVGTDSTPWSGTWSESGAVWGDPESGIVGDLDGKANSIGWGYGTHWQPIAKAINSFGRTAETKSNWSVQGIAQEIANGNPVIIWWVNGVWPSYEVNWKTPGGKSIRAVNGMHVQVVKGFSGTIENPTSFTVTDSGYGYPGKTFDTATFKAKWAWFNNTGIVVK